MHRVCSSKESFGFCCCFRLCFLCLLLRSVEGSHVDFVFPWQRKLQKIVLALTKCFGCQHEFLVGESDLRAGNVIYFSSHCFSWCVQKEQMFYTDCTNPLPGVNCWAWTMRSCTWL